MKKALEKQAEEIKELTLRLEQSKTAATATTATHKESKACVML